MIINLKKDSCVNAATTEVRSERQDYLDMPYSQWRLMIVNMFQKADQEMFLKMSDPDYVMKRLLKDNQFKCEIQMQNMQGEYI